MQIGEEGWMVMATDPTGAAFGLWQGGRNIGTTITEEPGSMAWSEVNTRNAVKARDFYCAMNGLTSMPMPGMEYCILQRGTENVAGVLQMDQNWPESTPPNWVAYFAVANADDTVKLAAQNGGKVRVEPFDAAYGHIAVRDDPFGAVFAVVAMSAA
jgi:uncharacterized protein